MFKFYHNRFFKPFLVGFVIIVLVCSFALPAFAITPDYVSNKNNQYYSMPFIEETLTRRLVNFYDYSMNSISNNFDKKFANAFFPSHSTYYTNSDFDALLSNAFQFINGETLANISSWQGYRYICYDPIRRGTSYTYVVAKSPVWTTATFNIEVVALGRSALRFKQSNVNSVADGGKRRFAIYNVFFPLTWSGGTTGVICTKQTIVDNVYPSGSNMNIAAPFVFAAENLLWMDSSTSTLLGGSRNYNNLNSFYSASVQFDCINPVKSLPGSTPNSNKYISCFYSPDRLSSDGQYSLDFEYYYIGSAVTDDFLMSLIRTCDPLHLSRTNGSDTFSVKSYELLYGSQRTLTSGGEVCYYITFRAYFQPPTVSLTEVYSFSLSWFEYVKKTTALTDNVMRFTLTNINPDTGDTAAGDVTSLWSQLNKSIDFARVVIQQLWIAMPPDIYSLLTVSLYLIIALAVIRLVI